ncbi:MAG TPA: methionyl-tRNA formyltransferase [Jiangellaceae bacterium]|nr:methionyl-tRNA formyltransferase [Jiangellaceae bacterium]
MVRVAVMGQAAFGKAVLDRLRSDGVTVSIVSAPEPSGGKADPLWEEGEQSGVPLVPTTALKTADGLEQWNRAGIDLCVMAFVTVYLPNEVFAVPSLGTIQYHPSLLPLHRGPSAMNWALINGETETGLSVFWPDEGLDTGPVLLSKRCEIRPDDTVGSLYFDQLFPLGIDALAESVALVADGNPPRAEQDHAVATYEPLCKDSHAQIHWHLPARRVYDLIRGCDPQPGAWTYFENEPLHFYGCRLTGEQQPGMPGEVLGIDQDGFTVRLNGGVLQVGRVRAGEARKVDAAEWAAQVGLQVGHRFRT